MSSVPLRVSGAAALWALWLYACADDGLDGKASAVTRHTLRDAGAAESDAGFDEATALLKLECKTAVLTETVTSGFVARVTDELGRVPAAPGLWVRLSPSTGNVQAEREGGGPTDEAGTLPFAFIAPHFDFDTPITLTASLRGAGDAVLAEDHCRFTVVTEGLRFLSPAADSSIPHGHVEPLRVALAVDAAADSCEDNGGVQFTFSGPRGAGLSLTPDGELEAAVCAEVIDGSVAPVFVGASERGGLARVHASAGAASADLAVKLVGGPSNVRFEADEHDISTASAANLTATVVDDVGQPVSDAKLQFELARCAAMPCDGTESVTPTSAISAADGTAHSAYFAGSTAGAAQISVTLEGNTAPSATVVIRVKSATP